MKKVKIDENIFRANDIRGAEEQYVRSQNIIPGSMLSKSAHGAIINAETAYVIGRSIADVFGPKKIVIGHDSRITSTSLYRAAINGLRDGGTNVSLIGISTSDLLYFAVGYYGFDMGVMITGSHTIKYLNGMKICRLTNKTVTPIYQGCGMEMLRDYAIAQEFKETKKLGRETELNCYSDYTDYILKIFPEFKNFASHKIILDAANGTAGVVYEKLLDKLNTEPIKLNFNPDGNFPAHDPDPAVFENMAPLVQSIKDNNAEFGVAWDGDADRVAFITKEGEILTGSHIGTMLLPWVANKYPKSAVVVTPPMTQAFFELAGELDIDVKYAKVGNSYVKKVMDELGSPFGAEEADHFMFSECYGTENGIIPLLIILELLNKSGISFDQMLATAKRGYYISGDVNFEAHDTEMSLGEIEKYYKSKALVIDKLDGLRVEFDDWRFCIRPSSIDPVLRLNVEARSETKLKAAIVQIGEIIKGI